MQQFNVSGGGPLLSLDSCKEKVVNVKQYEIGTPPSHWHMKGEKNAQYFYK